MCSTFVQILKDVQLQKYRCDHEFETTLSFQISQSNSVTILLCIT